MRAFNFDRNVRFSFLLPYGICSLPALLLSVPASDVSYAAYSDKMTMDERIKKCQSGYKSSLRMITAMEELGYIEEYKRQLGKKEWEMIRCFRLTKAGWYFLTNTPDDAIEQKRIQNIPRLLNRNKNELSYTPQDPSFLGTQQLLYDIASNPEATEKELQFFEQTFLNSVLHDDLSILAAEPYLAKQAQISTSLRVEAFYRNWKLANVEAMFKTNNYLTSIDRRHLITKKTVVENHAIIEVQDFCKKILGEWYQKHPASFVYTTPHENYADQVQNYWKTAPAFYPIGELDDMPIEITISSNFNEKSTVKSYRYLCIGVAVGKEKNYIVHHTRSQGTPWAEIIEQNTIGGVQQRINQLGDPTNALGTKRSISNAIMICPTLRQFKALFAGTSQNTKEEKKRKYRAGYPYDSVSIVPICPSGTMQLRGLMESSPLGFERAICEYLLQFDGFAKRPSGGELYDYIFQLSYCQTPVLVAHTMDWQKLTIARDLYLDGRRFYVSCYPDQAKYIKAIMPNVEFL